MWITRYSSSPSIFKIHFPPIYWALIVYLMLTNLNPSLLNAPESRLLSSLQDLILIASKYIFWIASRLNEPVWAIFKVADLTASLPQICSPCKEGDKWIWFELLQPGERRVQSKIRILRMIFSDISLKCRNCSSEFFSSVMLKTYQNANNSPVNQCVLMDFIVFCSRPSKDMSRELQSVFSSI